MSTLEEEVYQLTATLRQSKAKVASSYAASIDDQFRKLRRGQEAQSYPDWAVIGEELLLRVLGDPATLKARYKEVRNEQKDQKALAAVVKWRRPAAVAPVAQQPRAFQPRAFQPRGPPRGSFKPAYAAARGAGGGRGAARQDKRADGAPLKQGAGGASFSCYKCGKPGHLARACDQ